MIKSWSVNNFKAISSSTVELSNLNVLVGRNSIGKSSLIQSILAMGQYFQEQMPNSKISFIGNTLDLGPANSVINRDSSDKSMSFEVEWLVGDNPQVSLSAGLEMKLGSAKSEYMELLRLTLNPRFLSLSPEGRLVCTVFRKATTMVFVYALEFSDGYYLDLGMSTQALSATSELALPSPTSTDGITSTGPIWLVDILPSLTGNRSWIERGAGARTYVSMQNELGRLVRDAQKLSRASNKASKAFSFLDAKETEWLKGSAKKIDVALGYLAGLKSSPKLTRHQRASTQDALLEALEYDSRNRLSLDERRRAYSYTKVALIFLLSQGPHIVHSSYPEFSWIFEPSEIRNQELIYSSVGQSLGSQKSLFQSKVKYLGPIRTVQPGDQKNGKSSSVLLPLGRSGEFMASFLHANSSRIAQYALPFSKSKQTSLQSALDAWVNFFELGSNTRTKSSEWGATDFTLDGERTSQKGTGVSQVLPVLLTCLAAKPGDTILIEQPELHLHPAHQRKLADFFVAMSNNGIQLILETHSEYLITRLRLLVAQETLLPEKLKIIFSETKTRKGAKMLSFREAKTDKYGKLDYWPKGFFDDALVDRVLLSTIQYASEFKGKN